jgi:tetratricopeptide (TPR) repeat protein
MATLHISDGSSPESPGRRESHASSIARALVQAGLIWLVGAGAALAQSQSESSSPNSNSTSRILSGDDSKRVEALQKTVVELESKGQFADAATKVRGILAIRAPAQGNNHWETADSLRRFEVLTTIAAMPPEARATLVTAERVAAEGDALFERGEHLKARPLRQEATDLFRRMLGESHEWTARSEEKLAYILYRLGRSTEAEPLFRKARTNLLRVLGEQHPDVARISHELGYCLDALKKFDEAGRLFEQASQIWKRTRGEDHAETAAGYDGLANHLKELGKHDEAEPLFRKALEIDRRVLGEDNAQTACVYFNLGYNLFVRRQRLPESEELHRKALAIRLNVLTENHSETALSYSGLAWTLAALDRRDEVEPLYRKALEVRLKVLGEDHLETARSYDDWVGSLEQLGRLAESEPPRRKALAIRLKLLNPDDAEIALGNQSLANTLYRLGKYDEAELYYHKALAIRLVTLGEGHLLTAEIYNDLAGNLWSQGKNAAAEPLFQKVLEIRRFALGEHHPGTAYSYQNLAMNSSEQGKHAEAEQCFQKALAILEKPGENDPNTATIHDNWAYDLYAQGKYAEAVVHSQKALSIWSRTSGENHPDMASSSSNLALFLDAQGEYSTAERHYLKALVIFRRNLGEYHPETAFTYNKLAANLHAQGKSREREAESLAVAAAQRYEVARSRVSFTGLDRAEFAAKRSPSLLVASLLARRGRDQDAWQYWESGLARGLFDDLAARRGRPLTTEERRQQDDLGEKLDRLDNQISALASVKDLGDDQRRALDKLQIERLELQGQLTRFESELVRKYQVAAGRVYSLEKIQARLTADAALVGWLDLRTVPNADDPQGDHWACVVRHRGAPRWIRIRGTGQRETWTQADDQRPGAVRQLIAENGSVWQKRLAELANQRLAPVETAFGAGNGLPAVRHLIVLPSPALAGIPVETLLLGRPPSAPVYVVSYAPSGTLFAWLDEHDLDQQGRPSQPRLLALGDPVPQPAAPNPEPPDHGVLVQRVEAGSNAEQSGIQQGDVLLRYAGVELATHGDLEKQVRAVDNKDAGVVVSVWRDGKILDRTLRPGLPGIVLSSQPAAKAILAQHETDTLIRRTRSEAFIPLPGSRREVQDVARLFVHDQATVLLGPDACEARLGALRDRGELERFSFIHLATHGEMDDLSPMNSRLILSQDGMRRPIVHSRNEGPVFDGTLSASEVMGTWKLKAELVTLSACKSGLGRQSGGEGYLGFSQALFLAGAKSIVLSLWNVDDATTALFMRRFYQNLLGRRPDLDRPLPKAEALAEAKRWLRSLTVADADRLRASVPAVERSDKIRGPSRSAAKAGRPYEHPFYWAAFILIGDPS